MLDELDRPVAPPGAQSSRRLRQALPEPLAKPLEEEHLAPGLLDRDPRRNDTRVVDDHELAGQLVRQLGEPPVPNGPSRPLVDEQPRRVAPLDRMLRDELRGQLVVQLR